MVDQPLIYIKAKQLKNKVYEIYEKALKIIDTKEILIIKKIENAKYIFLKQEILVTLNLPKIIKKYSKN